MHLPRASGGLLAVSLALLAVACKADSGGASAPPDLSADERAEAGALFEQHCALCHGERGDGHGVRHSGLVGRPVDFTNPGWRSRATFDSVVGVIENGKPGTSMPAWRSLSDEDVRQLAAYVLSIGEQGP